ncbi:MAG: cation diffusion facilitator family transporter [Christensenellales bacterium]
MKTIDYRHGEKITITCILGNIVLSLLKFAAGVFGNSQAMISDALHSASDIIATSVVLIGIRIARKPVDKEHPYGHGRVEPIAASFVGVTLVIVALMIIKGIVESAITHSFSTPTFLALIAAILSIVVKEAMYRVTYAAGKKISSKSMIADAWHHRSDAFSSIGSFLGILGSMIGKWLNISFLSYLDPIAGAVVACLIFKIAYDILRDSIKSLMDASPRDEKIQSIKDIALSTKGIISVPQIKGRYVGQHLFVDIEIEVKPDITVEAGHDIAAQVRKKILDFIDDVYEVIVHVEPERIVNEKAY